MSDAEATDAEQTDTQRTEPRTACPYCGASILVVARKCRGCRRWLDERTVASRHRGWQVAALVSIVLICAGLLAMSGRHSQVGEAPPLTPTTTATATTTAAVALPLPEQTASARPLVVDEPLQANWRTRRIKLDVHPLDVVFSPGGRSLLVSADDASLREYDVATGKLLHRIRVPAQGDRIRLLHQRYVAVLRLVDAAHVPVVDTQHWEREPMVLWVGGHPADVIGLPDGHSVVMASSRGKQLSSFDLNTGQRRANIRLPHATRDLYLLQDGERPLVGAIGSMRRGGRPAGAWIDLFDPSEQPFGATRRSISVGRDPQIGATTADQASLFFVDRVSNSASLLRVHDATKLQTVTVGQGPVAGFLLAKDQYGITLDGVSHTATVLSLGVGDTGMQRQTTLMLHGSPNAGSRSGDGRVLFVALGGEGWPPRQQGAAVITGDPPQVVAHLDTGAGASRVAANADGSAAAVLGYLDRSITLIQR